MNPIVSLPVAQAQPSTASYDVSSLYLFQTYTRASYLAQFGVQAPPYDPSRPIQAWFDTSAAPGPYKVITGSGGSATLIAQAVPANVGVPNLPGDYVYPAWTEPTTTPAVVGFAGGTPLPDQALVHLLCSLADAAKLAAMWGSPAPIENTALEANVQAWNGETRRIWMVMSPQGQLVTAKGFLEQMYAKGVDPLYGPPPGSWGVYLNNPEWYFHQDPAWAELPTVPVPCRDLLPGETFAATMLGVGTQIVNTKMLPATGASGAGSYADADRTRDNSTHLMMLEVVRALGLPTA